MNEETKELELLTAAWNAQQPSAPAGLALQVRRHANWVTIQTIAAVTAAAAFFGGSLWVANQFGTVEFVVLAIGVWMLTLTTLISQLESLASLRTPESQTPPAFLDLSLRKCRNALKGIQHAQRLLLVEVVLLAAWHIWYWSSRSQTPALWMWLLSAALPLAFLVGLRRLRDHRQKQLTSLERLQQELSA